MNTFKKKIFNFFISVIIFSFHHQAFAFRDPYPKNPKIDVINYVFELTLSDEKDEIFCNTTIDFRFKASNLEKIRLDLTNYSEESENKGMLVERVESNNVELKFTHQENELWVYFDKPSEKDERIKFSIQYKGVPANGLQIGNNKYGDRTFFSDNWPNKARHWLATIDHPYDKAMCEFIVTAPDHYQVVSNGLKIEETNLHGNLKLTHWKQSIPIASWLYVLGVADFAVQYHDEFRGKSLQTWVFKQDRDAGFYDFKEPTKKVLEFYSSYIGPYSYEKLANIQSNSVSGGMEAASAILYSANSVKGDRNIRWRNVVIHEIAHQWFGNAVTEYDWDDVWLSEGFATYFTLLFIEHQYGREAFVEGLKSSQKRVDLFYKKNPEYTIIHNNLKDMNEVTSSQTYQKGSWVLHMLRGVLGTEIFWKGIRAYYLKFKDLNASTEDFKIVMEEVSGLSLTYFFKQWLYSPGNLKLNGFWQYDKINSEIIIELNQVQNGNQIIELPLEIEITFENDNIKMEKVQLNGKSNTYRIKSDKEPLGIILDPNLWILMNSEFQKKETRPIVYR